MLTIGREGTSYSLASIIMPLLLVWLNFWKVLEGGFGL